MDYYTYAWTKDPIANAFIPQSGTATSFANPPPLNNTEAFVNGSIALGCGDGSSGLDAALACVRTKPFTNVLAATKVSDPLRAVLGNFGPTVDGKVIFNDYTKRAERGDFIQRPYMTGNNNYASPLTLPVHTLEKYRMKLMSRVNKNRKPASSKSSAP